MAIATTSITEVVNNGGGTWKDYGGGGGSVSNTNVFVTSTGSRARKVSNGIKGFAYDLGVSGTDISAQVVSVRWATLAGVGALDTRTNAGVFIVVEDTSGNLSYWDVDGSDTYGGGWKVSAVSMATTPSRNGGTAATLTAVRYIGVQWDETATVGGGDPNCYIDQILYWPIAGVTITGNTTAFIDDLVDTIDNPANGPYGLFERRSGQVFAKPRMILSPDASNIAEADRYLILENPVYDAGSTIDSTLDEIGIESSDADAITFTRCTIISADPDETVTTDANREFDFTSAGAAQFDTCQVVGFDGTVVHLGGTGNDFDGTTFQRCGPITSTGATLNDGFIRSSVAAADGSALIWNANLDPDGDVDGLFISKGANAHHGIELSTTSPLTVTFRSIVSSGFNAADTNNDSFFYVRRTTSTVTINVIGGTGNFSYKSSGATVDVVLDTVTLTITAIDNVTKAAIQNAYATAWCVATTPTGPFDPATVTITRVTTTATVAHTAHGLSTGDEVRIEGADQAEYNGFKTITVTGANAYTFTVSGSPTTPATGTISSGLLLINGQTDANGEAASAARSLSAVQDFLGEVKKGSASPVYIAGSVSGSLSTSIDTGVTASLVLDE